MPACPARLRLVAVVMALAGLTFFTGCQRSPLDRKIDARGDSAFAMWVASGAKGLTADERRELTEARQQIKFAVMNYSPGLPAEEFNRAVSAEIYGRTVREVLLRSVEIQSERIAAEILQLEGREENYRKVKPSSLSVDAREFLEGFNARMEKRRADLHRLDERKILLLSR